MWPFETRTNTSTVRCERMTVFKLDYLRHTKTLTHIIIYDLFDLLTACAFTLFDIFFSIAAMLPDLW